MLGLELNFAVSIPCRPFTWFFMKNCEQRAYPPLQGLECKAVQAVLKHPAFVEALYALLKPYSKAVPALAMTIQELARMAQRHSSPSVDTPSSSDDSDSELEDDASTVSLVRKRLSAAQP